MNYKTLQKLEFQKVMERLAGFCGSVWGKEFLLDHKISDSKLEVTEMLAETTEARNFVEEYGNVWDFGLLPDVEDGFRKLEGGAVLEPLELLGFAKTLEFAGEIKGTKIDTGKYSVISDIRDDIFVGSTIYKNIRKAVDDDGRIKDSASSELSRARKKIRDLEKDIPGSLMQMVRTQKMEDVVQDRVVTIRNGRFVIPIRSEQMTKSNWVLQDRSSSGSTSFVEPIELVEQNNRLTRERIIEKSEVLKILKELSSMLSTSYSDIERTIESLGELDFLIARGRYSSYMNAVEPIISDADEIDIKSGRHPLLGSDAVGVDIELGGTIRTMVLTGPNAGGKTATLKLVGLFQLMAQAGLHLPAREGTRVPVFKDVFTVMGDEQSLEDNLSTFSSHLKEIKWVTDRADSKCLVLIDEICSGTDPEEGTALACSIIKELMGKGCVNLVTSHQSGLKTFATVTSGAENARMVFNENTREPVFRVEIGMPGKSYALEIASRVGFSEKLLDSAREYMSSQARMTDRLISDLEKMKSFLKIERESIIKEKKELIKEKDEHSRLLDEERKKNEQILNAAYGEAEKILDETKQKCDFILKQAKDATKLPLIASVKGEIKKTEKRIQKKKPAATKKGRAISPEDLGPDAWLMLRDSGETVQFLSGPDKKGRVKVLLGEFKVITDMANLSVADNRFINAGLKERDHAKFIINAKKSAKKEIDVRGMRAVEAIDFVDREINNLNVANIDQARIIHGIGTGALLKAIHEYLESNTFVRSFETCPLNEGGMGATRIYLIDKI